MHHKQYDLKHNIQICYAIQQYKYKLTQNIYKYIYMKSKTHRQRDTYYNQFIDVKGKTIARNKPKNNKIFNSQAIKIASNKLPSDFFRPFTRQNITIDVLYSKQLERQSGMKTPCFGQQRKQSFSLSLIPRDRKDKKNDNVLDRMETLPLNHFNIKYQELQQQQINNINNNRHHTQKDINRKNNTLGNDNPVQQQYSHRSVHVQDTFPTEIDNDINNIKKQLLRDVTHRSTQRQKIKYHKKKLTMNDELKLDLGMKNMQYQNRIRLNIKKFFREDLPHNFNQINNVSNISYLGDGIDNNKGSKSNNNIKNGNKQINQEKNEKIKKKKHSENTKLPPLKDF